VTATARPTFASASFGCAGTSRSAPLRVEQIARAGAGFRIAAWRADEHDAGRPRRSCRSGAGLAVGLDGDGAPAPVAAEHVHRTRVRAVAVVARRADEEPSADEASDVRSR
jgi:hypothetical protein